MSDWYYKLVRYMGSPAFWASASPVVLHANRARRRGAYILAPNHTSPYDIPCLIKETPRVLDFVSIVEVFHKPLVAWFFRNMGAMPLDRGRVDTATTRQVLQRLSQGRVVTLFPEGRVRDDKSSVLRGGPIKPGAFKIARAANVPIIPCVILGTRAYHRFSAWLPARQTVYAVNYGHPLVPDEKWDDLAFAEKQLREAYADLHAELRKRLKGPRVM